MAKTIEGYGSTPCEIGCQCGHHRQTGCAPDCQCGKHALRNGGQFQAGRAGRDMGGGAKRGWKGTVDERFAAKVVVAPDGCHLWTGARTTAGYGSLRVDGRTVYAHAYADDRVRGPIPSGLNRDHLCRVRHCVNPDHIERVTPAENNRRARRAVGVGG